MAVLLDTNILLRLVQNSHAHSSVATRATNALDAKHETMLIAHQSVVEFWTVATRPTSANGLGFSIEEAKFEMDELKMLFGMLPEMPVHDQWQRLVIQYRVSGKNVHDARLVAAMLVHGVKEILTFNVADFARYTEIVALDPVGIA